MMHLLSLLLEAVLQDGGRASSEAVLPEGDGPMKTSTITVAGCCPSGLRWVFIRGCTSRGRRTNENMMHLLSLLLEAVLQDGGGSSSETVLQEGDGPMKTWCI